MAWWRPWKDGGKFDRCDWIRYCASVIGAIAGMVVWFAVAPPTEGRLEDGLIGALFIVGSLSSVLAVGVGLFGKSKDRLLMEEIRDKQDEMLAKQDEIIRLLRIIAEAILKDKTVLLDKGGETTAAGRGGDGGGDGK